MKYLLGLDIGTSSVKGVLTSVDGEILKTVREPFLYQSSSENIVEISAESFLDVCMSAIKKLTASAQNGSILALCASSASGNLLLLDKNNKPSTPIINWQDCRVTDEATQLLGDIDLDWLYNKTGWRFDMKTFPLAQLCYIKTHQNELFENCGKVCMSTEYLYYYLTGKWGISTSAGTPFYLIEQQTGKYIPELLNTLNIDEKLLPPVMKCGSVLGKIKEELTGSLGLSSDTNVVIGSFDHPSAARGVGVTRKGEMLLSCGTSWVGFFPIADRKKAIDTELLIDPFLSPDGGCHAGMFSLASISERIHLHVERHIDSSPNAYNILADLASKSTKGANGLKISILEEPSDIKVEGYSKEDIARAIMEGTVYLLKQKLDELKAKGIFTDRAVMVGGPSENPLWAKIIGEICEIKVKILHASFAGAVGAAIISGIGAGVYKNEEDGFDKMNKSLRYK